MFTFNVVMRKWLKIERKPSFFTTFVNDKHKKIEGFILIAFLVTMIIGFVMNVSRPPDEYVWFLQPHILVFIYAVVSEVARAIMERKYAPNKKDYILTLSQIVLVSIIFITVLSTEFFGLFN